MHRSKVGVNFLVVVSGISVFTALSHLSCIVLGESCYRAQLAPEPIIQSAINGTMLAPVGTIFVSALFLLCAAYALSAAKLIIKLPLLSTAVYTISMLCLLRGVATIPLSLMYPDMVTNFSMLAGALWFISGVLILLGLRFANATAQ